MNHGCQFYEVMKRRKYSSDEWRVVISQYFDWLVNKDETNSINEMLTHLTEKNLKIVFKCNESLYINKQQNKLCFRSLFFEKSHDQPHTPKELAQISSWMCLIYTCVTYITKLI